MPTGFGPGQRSRRLLRQAAGLMPPSDVQPVSTRPPAVQAALNLQLGAGLLTELQFQKAMGLPVTPGAPAVVPAPSRRAALQKPGSFGGAPLPPGGTPTTGPVGVIDPFAAALQQRPAQFREKALTGRPRRVGMTRAQTQAQSRMRF